MKSSPWATKGFGSLSGCAIGMDNRIDHSTLNSPPVAGPQSLRDSKTRSQALSGAWTRWSQMDLLLFAEHGWLCSPLKLTRRCGKTSDWFLGDKSHHESKHWPEHVAMAADAAPLGLTLESKAVRTSHLRHRSANFKASSPIRMAT